MTDNPPDAAGGGDGENPRTVKARSAYARRTAQRARRARAESQAMRHERERLSLATAVRRELRGLADGSSDLARTAAGNGKAAEQAADRLAGRRARAREVLTQADRFAIDPGLTELDTTDRAALQLPEN